jgi:hypothetical protein
MSRSVVVVLVTAGFVAGCGSEDAKTAQSPSTTPQSTSSARPASIVGRWEVLRTCQGMVEALDRAGLRKLAPSIVGDYFPGKTPRQLARKADVCAGATPQQHSHFFTGDGKFGSLDQRGEQVDDAPYRVVDEGTIRLSLEFGDEDYRYTISGDELTLEPVVTASSKRAALANPLEFSLAAHSAAVAYAGHPWKWVGCDGWC